MGEQDLINLKMRSGVAPWRISLARRVESKRFQYFVVGVILFNAVILGLETSHAAMDPPFPPRRSMQVAAGTRSGGPA